MMVGSLLGVVIIILTITSRLLNFQRYLFLFFLLIYLFFNCNTNRTPPLTGFRYLVHSLEPRYVIPSRSIFTLKLITDLYKETKLSLQESLNSAHRVAIMCDA